MKFQTVLRSVFLLISVSILGGCATLEDYYSPYESGTLQGEGVRIEAEDGSFILKKGRFTPPFQTVHSVYMPSITFASDLTGVAPSSPSLIGAYGLALRQGAKKVRIYHPAATEPLYGVLLLNQKMPGYSTGPAARSYLIRVPDSYVKEATDGRVSVVYEPVTHSVHPNAKFIGWALWLSDSPF